MSHYIDGFVLPIPRKHLDAYKRLAKSVADVWADYGALDYREYVGDDMMLQGTRSFTDCVDASASDIVIFGWVKFESREARDIANAKVPNDPRMADIIALSNSGFDASKMIYGGFRPLVGN